METAVAPVAPRPETPASPVAPAPVANADTFLTDSDKVTPDALLNILPMPPSRAPQAPAAAAPAAPVQPAAPTQPATPAATAPVVTDPNATQPAQQEENIELPKNYRLHARDAKEAMMLLLIKQGKSAPEAYSEIYGTQKPETTTATTTTAQPEVPAAQPENPLVRYDSTITTLSTEIADLQTQIDKAKADGELATAIDLVQQQGRKERLLEQNKQERGALKFRLEQQQVEAQSEQYRQAQAESARTAIEKYPQLADPKGEARAAFNLLNKQLRSDPRWAPVFDSPEWPSILAQRVAEQQGWNATPKVQTAAPAQQPPAQPTNTVPSTNPLAPQPVVQPNPAAVRATAAEVLTPASTPNGGSPTIQPSPDSFDRDLGAVPAHERLAALYDVMNHAPIPEKLRMMAGRKG